MSKINTVHDKFLRAITGSVIKVSALTDEQIIRQQMLLEILFAKYVLGLVLKNKIFDVN